MTDLKPIIFPDVNGCVICDCGHAAFRVGVEVDEVGNNDIRCIECIQCDKQFAVPFFDDGSRAQGLKR